MKGQLFFQEEGEMNIYKLNIFNPSVFYKTSYKYIFYFFILLTLIIINNSTIAAGRMYQPRIIYPTGHHYEPPQKYEVCRLRKEERYPTEVKCFYMRQDKNGSDEIITNDQPSFSCQGEIKCKVE